jgi:hypothetical protein
MAVGRRKPYTAIGIARLACFRCGAAARTQWQICSDGNIYRPVCLPCDVELNRMVLVWAFGEERAAGMIEAYKERVQKQYGLRL